MMRAALAVLLVAAGVAGWDTGDFVPLMARSQYGNEVTSPRELGHDLSPHFGRNKAVHIDTLSKAELNKGDDYKMSFELGHGLGRRTPWIVVQQGCTGGWNSHDDTCVRLHRIDFVFTYEMGSFGKIVDFQVYPHYMKPREQYRDHIVLDFVWKQDHDKDINTALFTIYSVSVIASIVLLSFMFVNTDSVRKGEMLVKDLRSQ
eukprot:TRINITY_DN8677_c0_g1_i1.p1 TRINITY_DN8677_c0_g1~~TRINITY_DN8677_c0_g1_i1.p1  ORF type:complete len:203 (+),score=57.33 TRINITY_DN8677_c0_g1_i1:88-696(+)